MLAAISHEGLTTLGGGNCGALAILKSHQPSLGIGTQDFRHWLSRFIVTLKTSNPIFKELWHDRDFDKKAKSIANDGHWFDSFYIAACSVMLGRTIVVIYETWTKVDVMLCDGTSRLDLLADLVHTIVPDSPGSPVLVICHTGQGNARHYHATQLIHIEGTEKYTEGVDSENMDSHTMELVQDSETVERFQGEETDGNGDSAEVTKDTERNQEDIETVQKESEQGDASGGKHSGDIEEDKSRENKEETFETAILALNFSKITEGHYIVPCLTNEPIAMYVLYRHEP